MEKEIIRQIKELNREINLSDDNREQEYLRKKFMI